jgi:hypothetical protein
VKCGECEPLDKLISAGGTPGFRRRPQPADRGVRVTERLALRDQRVGQLDRQQVRRQALRHALGPCLQRCDRRRQCRQQQAQRVGGVEHRFLVFLKILLVRGRKALHHDRETLRVREQATALPARELEQVGVALLRQQARAVAKPSPGRTNRRGRAPQHEIFGEP